MINIKRKNEEEFKIDISALVDVMFTLLIFFSLTSTFVQEAGLKVDLPEASSSGDVINTQKIDISITGDGKIYIDNDLSDLKQLENFFSKFDKQSRMKYLIVIKADTVTQHGKVTEVLDLLKTGGFKNIAIATQSKSR